jgi:excinuclease ABC subunit C
VDLRERVESLPSGPGVYLFESERGKVLYVGKAQNLRSRVRSYFQTGGDGRVQIPRLVERIAEIKVLVTPTVKDALLLENELIKQHRPTFNVRLRDDKQYLALRLDPEEHWPRLHMVRRFRQDRARYFGPYTSSGAMRAALSNLRRIFPLRSCSDAVLKDYARRGRPCIEYEMKRCSGPCCGLIGEEAYAELVQGTELFLRGRSEQLMTTLREKMEEAAEEERFEDAARLRDRIGAVERTLEQQQIVGDRLVDRDVFALARDGGEVELQVLHVRDGRVVGAAEYDFSEVRLDDGDVMGSFLGQYYGGGAERQVPAEVLSAAEIEDGGALEALLAERAGRRVAVRTPKRGSRRELVKMAAKNAELGLARRLEARESMDAALEELRDKLGLANLPRRIECYDVSNLQGALAVASRVVFESGQPQKSAYRRYKIREARGGDDLACMREALERARCTHGAASRPRAAGGSPGHRKAARRGKPVAARAPFGGIEGGATLPTGSKGCGAAGGELARPSADPAGARRIPSLRHRVPAQPAAKGGSALDSRGASRNRTRQASHPVAANGVASIGERGIGAGSLRRPRHLETRRGDDSRFLPGGWWECPRGRPAG